MLDWSYSEEAGHTPMLSWGCSCTRRLMCTAHLMASLQMPCPCVGHSISGGSRLFIRVLTWQAVGNCRRGLAVGCASGGLLQLPLQVVGTLLGLAKTSLQLALLSRQRCRELP